MVDFHGWDMPLYYRGITEEHAHTRESAGLFDLCHMGRIYVRGPGALEFLDRVTPAHIRTAHSGQVLYSFLLDEQGCTIDDITIYIGDDWHMIVVNSSNREKDLDWLKQHAVAGVEIEDVSDSMAMFAIQGPDSDRIISSFLSEMPLPIPYYEFRHVKAPTLPYAPIISATGYTGEHGYEIYTPADHALGLWSMIFAAQDAGSLWPIGLGARDSLRLEAAMPLYGNELGSETTPLDAGLGKFIDFEKRDFIGRAALLGHKQLGVTRKLVGFEMTQRGAIARQGHAILDAHGANIGAVTSGIFSPTLQRVIGMAYVDAREAQVGAEISIEIRGRRFPARIVKKPFYKRTS